MFSPLDCSTRSIRLIEILPGDDPQIRCRFHVHELNPKAPSTGDDDGKSSHGTVCSDEETSTGHAKTGPARSKVPDPKDVGHPKFTSLSYTWGPPKPASEISINCQPFMIRQNLWLALSSIREKIKSKDFEGPRLFWIDAISIDQKNILERNHQVNMMKDIFSHASLVLVWLGSGADSSSLALKFISTVSTRVGKLDENENEPAGPRSMSAAQKQAVDMLFKDLATQSLEEPILSMCSGTYWTRLWIVQEVLLAKDLLVLCGEQFCDWESLKSLLVIVEYIFRSEDIPVDGIVMRSMNSPAGEFFENWDDKGGADVIRMASGD